MADIELVVKIDEEDYKEVLNINNRDCTWNNMHRCYEAVLNGTPLPKGYKLMNVNKFINSLKGIERLHIDDELRSNILDTVNTNILVEADKAESEDKK